MLQQYHPGNEYWSPIRGGGSPVVSTWHDGPNNQGSTSLQDDMAIVAGPINGFGYRDDDHSGSSQGATPLTFDGVGWAADGIIETNDDIDVFSFSPATSELVFFDVDVAPVGPNLDVVLELQDDSGTTLIVNDPTDSLDAGFAANLVAGSDYFVLVRSSDEYGRVGQYSVNVHSSSMVSPGPNVIDLTPSGFLSNQSLDSIRVTFDKPIDPTTFDAVVRIHRI